MSNGEDEETGNGRRATGNAGKPTGDGQQATGNGQLGGSRGLRVGEDIAQRLLGLATAVVGIVKALPRDVAGRHVASQLVRAATSGGANYEEARAAETRADFIHKVSVAAKEVREAIFWLRLIDHSGLTTLSIARALREATELAAILSSSARTARARMNADG